MSLEVGHIVEGKVTGITNFGAFVELGDGKTGLVHISEVADAYVEDIRDFLKEQEVVKVKVINIRDGKIGLSIRQVNSSGGDGRQRPAGGGRGRPPARGGGRRPPRSFEDKLSRFLKDSDAHQQSLRKSLDGKRGGRGTRRGV